jgi:hypothetical protein
VNSLESVGRGLRVKEQAIRRTFLLSLVMAVLLASWTSWSLAPARAGSTATPTVVDQSLAAPTEVAYAIFPNGNFVRWRDHASGEDGYRIDVTLGEDNSTFEVGPNLEEFRLPDGFGRGCPSAHIEVRAFRGPEQSEPGIYEFPADCFELPTPTPGRQLPLTGTGGPSRSHLAILPLLAALLLAGAIMPVVLISSRGGNR